MLTQGFTYPIAQPQIIRLEPDVEGEKSFYTSGQDYKETDSTSVMAVADFKMSVLSTGPDEAQVRIQYGTNGRPDLYIRPVARRRQLAEPRHRSAQRAIGHGSGALVQHSVDRACEHGRRSVSATADR